MGEKVDILINIKEFLRPGEMTLVKRRSVLGFWHLYHMSYNFM